MFCFFWIAGWNPTETFCFKIRPDKDPVSWDFSANAFYVDIPPLHRNTEHNGVKKCTSTTLKTRNLDPKVWRPYQRLGRRKSPKKQLQKRCHVRWKNTPKWPKAGTDCTHAEVEQDVESETISVSPMVQWKMGVSPIWSFPFIWGNPLNHDYGRKGNWDLIFFGQNSAVWPPTVKKINMVPI